MYYVCTYNSSVYTGHRIPTHLVTHCWRCHRCQCFSFAEGCLGISLQATLGVERDRECEREKREEDSVGKGL